MQGYHRFHRHGWITYFEGLCGRWEPLGKLELGGQKLSKNDILKTLDAKGAAQAVQALLENSEALAKLEFSDWGR
ncbi:hypothetical protein AJ88_37955 [Mesorhizobium amorphae CCBAU 01583]|nr:hypothetical protein AJ88_37955 [Mesorhizobium amorphae CCBAU 01583]